MSINFDEETKDLVFSHTGCFRRDSELWWIGIHDNKALTTLQSSLIAALKEKGFHPDSKRFKPHITLAREMHAGSIESKKLLPESFACKATSVSLMLSHRPGGKLTYTELYAVNAAPNVRS